jgi:hypothetical protein
LSEDPAKIGEKITTRIFLPEAVSKEEAAVRLDEKGTGNRHPWQKPIRIFREQ